MSQADGPLPVAWHVVDIAAGVLMEQKRTDASEAYVQLFELTFALDKPLEQVAHAVVEAAAVGMMVEPMRHR